MPLNPYALSQGRPKTSAEALAYDAWVQRNGIEDSPMSDYDNFGAFSAGVERDAESKHFPDTYKLPWHETFSNESKYYRPGMAAVQWVNNRPVPVMERFGGSNAR